MGVASFSNYMNDCHSFPHITMIAAYRKVAAETSQKRIGFFRRQRPFTGFFRDAHRYNLSARRRINPRVAEIISSATSQANPPLITFGFPVA